MVHYNRIGLAKSVCDVVTYQQCWLRVIPLLLQQCFQESIRNIIVDADAIGLEPLPDAIVLNTEGRRDDPDPIEFILPAARVEQQFQATKRFAGALLTDQQSDSRTLIEQTQQCYCGLLQSPLLLRIL